MYSYGKTSPPISPPLSPTSPAPSMNSLPGYSSPVPSTSTQSQAHSSHRHTAGAKRTKYLRRIFKFRQMDFQYAMWQMLHLFISPQKVYRNHAYRKHTKDQWARDDPAFLVLLSFWLVVSSIGFAIVLSLHFIGFIKFILWVVFVDCIGVGLLVASGFWLVANRYMILLPRQGQDVEWGYAFDVHLNAFFPLLMILHLFQLPLLNTFITHDHVVARLFGNSVWLCALTYYIYITFLGYSSLPFLKKTQFILYPMTVVFLIWALSLGLGWNFSSMMCYFYKYRVL